MIAATIRPVEGVQERVETKACRAQDVMRAPGMAAVMLSEAELEATAEENPTVGGDGTCLTHWSQLSC